MKIHTGDTIVVITGKDKGKTGSVLRILAAKNRLVVGGVNMRTKHVRATPQRAGQKIRYEASIHASNVMIVDPKSKKRTRIGYVCDEKGKKRIAKRSGEVLVVGKVVKAKVQGKKSAQAKEEKEVKEAEEAKETKQEKKVAVERVAGPAKQPFWKRMVSFGADAAQEAEGEEVDHSIPRQIPPHHKSTARGS